MPPADPTPRPWHREPWPWVLIGILGATVVASGITLWLAISNPDPLVLRDEDWQRVQAELRAQPGEDGDG